MNPVESALLTLNEADIRWATEKLDIEFVSIKETREKLLQTIISGIKERHLIWFFFF